MHSKTGYPSKSVESAIANNEPRPSTQQQNLVAWLPVGKSRPGKAARVSGPALRLRLQLTGQRSPCDLYHCAGLRDPFDLQAHRLYSHDMNITKVTVAPEANCIAPTLRVEALVSFQPGREGLLSASGVLRAEDGTQIALLHAYDTNASVSFELAADDARNPTVRTIPFLAELSERALDHVDECRDKNRKRDVVLTVEFSLHVFVSKALISSIYLGDEIKASDGRQQVGQAMAYRWTGRNYSQGQSDLWVLSGNGSRAFAEIIVSAMKMPVTIPASDFVHDFASAWRGGRFVVFEVPAASPTVTDPAMKDRMTAALDNAANACEKLIRGEWNDVIEDLRGVWELVRNEQQFSDLLKADGYSDDAIAALNGSFQKQFDFASKFVHRLDKGKKIAPELRASKEDAYLVYSIAMSLLNLIARKSDRLGR